jgi:aryl-alcohol dehydrogenase-like predicted oxidoreductase
LDELVTEGKVRYIGSSNFDGWQVVDADWVARSSGFERFISAQNKYSLYDRTAEDELIPACEHVGVGVLPYYPLEYGLLSGKYRRDKPAPAGTRLSARPALLEAADFDRIEALERFAAEHGVGILDVAIGGLAAQPAVASVIAGATRPEQVAANVAGLAWQPAAADLAALDELTD